LYVLPTTRFSFLCILYLNLLANQINYQYMVEDRLVRDTLCINATDKTWYTVLYHHTMYVISLSNISIKTNFKQIARVELKCVQYSEGDYILCMTSRYFFRSFTNVRLLCLVSHPNDMTSCQSSSAENVSCNVVPFFYHHSVVIQHLVSDRLLSLISKENVYNVR
jgi:hypothetical protein